MAFAGWKLFEKLLAHLSQGDAVTSLAEQLEVKIQSCRMLTFKSMEIQRKKHLHLIQHIHLQSLASNFHILSYPNLHPVSCVCKVRARQRIEVSIEGPQPVLITAKISAWKISINSRLRLSRLRRGKTLWQSCVAWIGGSSQHLFEKRWSTTSCHGGLFPFARLKN